MASSLRFVPALAVALCCIFNVRPVSAAVEREPMLERVAPDDLKLRQALYVANACEAAYMPELKLRSMLRAMGVERHQFLDFPATSQLSDTQILVATLGHYTIVCFRGTQELVDWKTNLATATTPVRFHERFPTFSVHSGFYSAWKEVRPALTTYLDGVGVSRWTGEVQTKNGSSCHEVLVGGHSLGGALATIGSLDLLARGYSILGVYTFGQPKVFASGVANKDWEGFLDLLDIQRFVFASDPVPALPLGFSHIGHERYSSKIGEIIQSPREHWYWPSANDHSMSNYVKTIASLISLDAKSPETGPLLQWLSRQDTPLPKALNLAPREAVEMVMHFTARDRITPCFRMSASAP